MATFERRAQMAEYYPNLIDCTMIHNEYIRWGLVSILIACPARKNEPSRTVILTCETKRLQG